MATEDARYRQSSQFRLWSFSPSQLAALREKTNALAQASITERLSSPHASAATSNANTPDPEGTPALPEFLTPAEEALVVTFYTSEVLRAGKHAEMSIEFRATAAVFFRRFYVTNSIMTYPPSDMLLVALFFGIKAEGKFPSITEYAAFPSTPRVGWKTSMLICVAYRFARTFQEQPEKILAGEFLLCQGIRFAFDVKHPFRALSGAIMELRRIGGIEVRDGISFDGAGRFADVSSII